ncbi:MAG: peptidoglycan DD-metalloendopeptidase family protein [Shewanella sp.]
MRAYGIGLLLSILISGCSLQSHKPAPVVSLSQDKNRWHQKGSIAGKNYTVKKGDTLYSIAWGAGTDFADLAKLNKLHSPYIIYPGQQLRLRTSVKKSSTSNNKLATNSTVNKSVVSQKTDSKAAQNNLSNDKNHKLAANSASVNNSAPTTKKVLASSASPTYSVTTAQQDVNRDINRPDLTVPSVVSRWSWPVKGRLIGRFSATEQGNNGIKIAGNRGDVIGAAAAGRVVYAGNALRGYGNLVIIKHSDDYLSAYAHADSILVKEKQPVQAGQAVAKMGSTGTNSVMLHFEIRYHGASVDPLKFLPKH